MILRVNKKVIYKHLIGAIFSKVPFISYLGIGATLREEDVAIFYGLARIYVNYFLAIVPSCDTGAMFIKHSCNKQKWPLKKEGTSC